MKLISEAVINTLAGEAAYQRGLNYYNEGKVTKLAINGATITARVLGTMPYEVQLHHTAKIFEGSCNCPASDHFDFCKHCAATALAYYYQTQTNQEYNPQQNIDSVEHYLSTLTKPDLSRELYSIIKRDKGTYELWKLRAELATGQLGAKELRKHITKALPFKSSGLWRYSEVANYFANAEQRLRALTPAFESISAKEVIKLAVYAYERLEKTLNTIDDSGGYRFEVMGLLKKWLQKSFSSSELDGKARLKLHTSFFTNEKFSYELLRDDAELFELLSNNEQKNLQEALLTEWKKLPPPQADQLYRDTPYNRIESMLLSLAQQASDTKLELELLAKSAVNANRCLELVKRCLEVGKIDEAEKWQAYTSQLEGLRLNDIAAIEHSQIQIWLAKEDYEQAINAQWLYFEEETSLAAFKDVLATGDALEQRSSWFNKGIEFLSKQIPQQDASPRQLERCETLVAIYLHENLIEQAVNVAHQYKLSPGTLMAVVNESPTLAAKQAKIALRATNYLIDLGSQQTYERAIGFLRKLAAKTPNPANQFAQLIHSVYQRPENKRKINFMKLFKAEFGDQF